MSHKSFFPFVLITLFLAQGISLAQRGKDGSRTITATNTVVNEYTLLNANASAGSSSISVVSSGLNDNGRFPGLLSSGDLLFIIQLQGASIFSDGPFNAGFGDFAIPKDSSWGSITSYNNCGNHEFAEVLSVPNGTTIELSCALKSNYTSSGKVMVVRVPRYQTLTVNASASITCDFYGGNSGGIVAVEVKGQTTLNGSINVNGRGFRGGNAIFAQATVFGTNDIAIDNINYGGEKGEGIGGFYNEYDNIPVLAGRYSRGAAGNAGGGGNALNAGGGGGGNGGNTGTYSGTGNPSLGTANWANAWNLEWAGFANTTSSGGGRGGYSAATANQNALLVRPGNPSWGGDKRDNVGGFGGRPLDYTSGRIFMGGGGGAGQGDDDDAGAGGRGGGLVYLLLYDQLNGSGSIQANGAAGGDALGSPAGFGEVNGDDGSGGGGAGGTILIECSGIISGITASANGGNGGNQALDVGFLGNAEAQGPGGGGGGGHISASNAITATVNGGSNGSSNSSFVSEFTPNGATSGGVGNNFGNQAFFDIDAPDVNICANSSTSLNANVEGSLPVGAVIAWYDAAVGGNLLGTGNSFITPSVSSNTSFYVGICPGSFREEVNVNVSAGVSQAIAGNDFSACPGDVVVLSANAPVSGNGTWSVVSGNASVGSPTDPGSSITIGNGGNVTLQWEISSPGCPTSTDQLLITVNPAPTPSNAGTDQTICSTTTALSANSPVSGTGTWQVLSGTGNFSTLNQPNASVTGLQSGLNVFAWVIDNGLCPSSSDLVSIQVDDPPTVAQAGSDQTLCSSQTQLSGNVPLSGNGAWSLISGNATINNVNDPLSLLSGLVSGVVTLEWSISNGVCPPSTDQVTINVLQSAAPADAGSDQVICAGSANLSAISPSNGTGTWTIVNGGGSLNNPGSATTTISGLTPGTTTLEWSITLAGCPPNVDQMTITVDAPPDIANAGSDQTQCLSSGTLINLNANTPITGIGTWSIVSGSGNIVSPNDPASALNGLSAGVTVLEWTTSNGVCPVSVDQVVVTIVSGPSPAAAGLDLNVCVSNASGLTLGAQAPSNGSGLWSVFSGNISVNNPNDPTSGIGNVSSGSQVLVWTVSVPGCAPNTDTLTLQIDALPSAADAGIDQSVCISGSGVVNLSAVAPSIGSGAWNVLSGNGSVQNTNQANSLLNISSTGSIVLSWTVSNGACPSNSDQVTIQASNGPGPAIAGPDQNVCYNSSLITNLNAGVPSSGSGLWSVLGGGGQIQNPTSNNTQISNLSEGINLLVWTVSLSGCPPVTDTLVIVATAPPADADAGTDQLLCSESGIATTLSAGIPAGGTGLWTLVSGSGSVAQLNSPVSSLDGLIAGTTVLVWSVQNGICPPSTDTVVIRVGNSNLGADAGSDVSIYRGESTQLSAIGSGSFSWSPVESLSCSDCPSPLASPEKTTVYYLSVTSAEGCTQQDSVTVSIDVKKDWFLPSAFSPNGDGNNDILYLRGYGIKSFNLQIYDRWGVKVFETSGMGDGWDGRYAGKNALAGVYQWSLEIDFDGGEILQQKGNLTLTR